MSDQRQSIGGVEVLVGVADGPPVGATTVFDLVGDALGRGAGRIALPVARLDPGFFSLRSGVAGDLDELAGRLAGGR